MMQTPARRELANRVTWALAKIAQLATRTAAPDWLEGRPQPASTTAVATSSESTKAVIGETGQMSEMAAQLALSPHELDALWLLVGAELDPRVAQALQLLFAPGAREISAQMLEQLVQLENAALPVRPFDRLVQLGLLHVIGEPNIPAARRVLRVDERVIDVARGELALDRCLHRCARLVSAVEARRRVSGLEIAVPDYLTRSLGSPDLAVLAIGPEGSGRSTLLCHAVSTHGYSCLRVNSRELPVDSIALERSVAAIVRECRLHAAWPMFCDVDANEAAVGEIERFMRDAGDLPLLMTMRTAPDRPITRTTIAIDVAIPAVDARAAVWTRALSGVPEAVRSDLARRYAISPGVIERCAATARQAVAHASELTCQHVQVALRNQLENKLSKLARRIETKQSWDDLVLPVDQIDLLIELIARVRYREQVLDHWGFADKIGRGLGMATLLSGPPGTGKTMIAGLVAKDLGLDLYQVDLANIVSKYIGETEKQLAALFDAAEAGHAILLFDEADSLFAKRTEVKTSNDRYANLEVNYLLQRIEAFPGIALLTTNHENAIDPAFMRRLAFHIRVPMPEEREREQLWRAMLPAKAAIANDLRFHALASEFVMSGGYIRNAVVRAAFLSAANGGVITQDHLLHGARAEYEAMGRVATPR